MFNLITLLPAFPLLVYCVSLHTVLHLLSASEKQLRLRPLRSLVLSHTLTTRVICIRTSFCAVSVDLLLFMFAAGACRGFLTSFKQRQKAKST